MLNERRETTSRYDSPFTTFIIPDATLRWPVCASEARGERVRKTVNGKTGRARLQFNIQPSTFSIQHFALSPHRAPRLQCPAMTKHALITALLLATLAPAQPANVSSAPILGFSTDGAVKEHALEAQLDGKLNRDHLREWLKRLSARPHHIGSPYDKDNTEFLVSLFKSWGYETRVEEFDVLFPTPKTRVVEMISPETYTLK